jgi:hypothetical protein
MTKTSHPEPHAYVVRIYRRTAQWLAGCVEDVRSGRVSPFGSPAELWAAIGGPTPSTPADSSTAPQQAPQSTPTTEPRR